MGVITFNGIDSTDYGIRVEKCPDYPAAQRKVEYISVEGRSGDLIRDTQAWNNVEQTYSVYFSDSGYTFQELSGAVARWLLGSKGYCRLEDDYDPTVYRKAAYSRLIQNRNFLNQKGRADLVFNCKPQRYFKDGEDWLDITSGDDLVNDWLPCYPVFEVTGNGTIQYGTTTITVTNNTGKTLYIDTELQDAYSGDLSLDVISIPYSFDHFYEPGVPVPWIGETYLPSNWTDYSKLYIQWQNYGGQGTYELDLTQDVIDAQIGDWFVSKLVADDFISFYPDVPNPVPSPWGSYFWISGTVKSFLNRNASISVSGPMDAFPYGNTQINWTVDDLKVQPRYWTL